MSCLRHLKQEVVTTPPRGDGCSLKRIAALQNMQVHAKVRCPSPLAAGGGWSGGAEGAADGAEGAAEGGASGGGCAGGLAPENIARIQSAARENVLEHLEVVRSRRR